MWSFANAQPAHRASRARSAGGIRRLICVVVRFLELAIDVRSERRALLKLDDHLLKDIGLSRCEAWAEACHSFWDIPRDRLL
jgi:uncharacterized protein YjiS (DUF1127 family)